VNPKSVGPKALITEGVEPEDLLSLFQLGGGGLRRTLIVVPTAGEYENVYTAEARDPTARSRSAPWC
jgi:hypothetical protein